jgi:hypothetical protein
MATTREVWRGLSVDRTKELDLSRLEPGDRLSPRRHKWWALKRGIAEAYATTGGGVPVLLKAELETDYVYETPCLPELEKTDRLTLLEVIWL